MCARTGMGCVLCWSFSLVGAGSSERAWLSLVCWLLILIRALWPLESGAPSPGAAAGDTICAGGVLARHEQGTSKEPAKARGRRQEVVRAREVVLPWVVERRDECSPSKRAPLLRK